MPLTEHSSDNLVQIQSITPESVTINTVAYTESLIITADDQILPWDESTLEPVLIGTGQHMTFLTPAQMAVFYQRGIGVEAMTTAAAVRTYTILTSEDRKVSVALKIGD
jgi:uncharacterized protein